MLPTGELSRLRSDLGITLPDTCVILTGTATVDGMGGQSTTWGTTYSAVACRLDHRAGREFVAGGALQPYSTNILTVSQSTTITSANRVEYGGLTYNVIDVSVGSLLGVKRCILEKL